MRGRTTWPRTRLRLALFATTILGGVSYASCGPAELVIRSNGDVCHLAYPDSCGLSCDADESCPTGLFCNEQRACDAVCAKGFACSEGLSCIRGRCETAGAGGSDSAIAEGGNTSGDGGADVCAEVEAHIAPLIPNIILLVDQSGSMSGPLDETEPDVSRWAAVGDILFNEADGVVFELESKVRFGLALYSADRTDQPGLEPYCPVFNYEVLTDAKAFQAENVSIDIALNNYGAMKALFDVAAPYGDTPTGDSIDVIRPILSAFPEAGPKAIILATDGEPYSCEMSNPEEEGALEFGQNEALAAVQAAFDEGIQTFVIAVGPELALLHQQELANAGSGTDNAEVYQAVNKADLITAFETIINGVRPCSYTLDGEVQEGQEDKGTVTLDGVPLSYNNENGWKLNSMTEIELVGEACTLIQTGDHELQVRFPCEAFIPVTP